MNSLPASCEDADGDDASILLTRTIWYRLMALMLSLQDAVNPWNANKEGLPLPKLFQVDKDMDSWYDGLPEPLKWLPENVASASSNFLFMQ